MARDNIPEYSATASANTVVADINIDEGCAPSGINNAIRAVMAALKDVDTGTTTLTSPAFTASTSATIKTATVKHTNDTASMAIAANGAVTFSQVPSLPDNSIETADVQDNAITLAKMAGLTRGSIIYGNANGDPAALAIGTGTLTGNGTDVSWGAGGFAMPAGAVQMFANETVPTGWLECNGAAVSRSTYATLFAAIGTLYGVGDGSSTFNVLDMRGQFPRGWSHGSTTDADRASRTNAGGGLTGDRVGTKQSDAIRNIVGQQASAYAALHQSNLSLTGAFYNAGSASTNYSEQSGLGARLGFDASRVVATGSDNRPTNVALMYCIKV